MKKLSISIVLSAAFLLPNLCGAVVRTVDVNGNGEYTTIQAAIDASASGDEVRVAKGAYVEHVTMKAGVDLFGGYSSIGWSRDAEKHVTTIDANGTGSAVTAASATLDGFTIKGSASSGIVAGVYVSACSPTVSNNKVTQNGKHGIYVEGNASPVIQKNVVSSNGYYGIYCYSFVGGGTPLIYNNTLDGNRRGIQLYSFSPVIKNNIISSSSEYGIAVGISSFPTADYNDLWSNTQGDYYDISAGPHDKAVDPLYMGSGDYRLSTSPEMSECIDAGTDVGLAYNNLPDMGAYESTSIQLAPWPPEGLMAAPGSAMVRLSWTPNIEPDLSGYKVSYGNVSGSYTVTIDVQDVTEYDVRSLINEATYFFAVRAYDTSNNLSGYSDEVSATPTAGSHELPHYDWDASFGGGDCTDCHYQDTGGGALLPAGYDYRYSTELCFSCHNTTGRGRGKLVNAASSHPVLVNVTSGGNSSPTYGNITGRFSNRMGDHLKDGELVVCNTCHNIMEKSEDPGRTWELTSFTYEDAWKTYALQKGGWYWYDYLVPDVYTSDTLVTAPTYVNDRRSYMYGQNLYTYNPVAGKITFNSPFFDYAYVTLRYPYLRVNNSDNVMCQDCHNMLTHKAINCLTCHESHNYTNRHGVRPKILTPNSGMKNVVFSRVTGAQSFADGDTVYDGVCEVCHTQTKYYRNNGTGFVNHSGGYNQSGKDCTACHTHVSGFSEY